MPNSRIRQRRNIMVLGSRQTLRRSGLFEEEEEFILIVLTRKKRI